MSWQEYVDSNLVGTGKVSKAAIFGLDGSCWAISKDLSIVQADIQTLIAAFDNPKEIQEKGIHLDSKKYVHLRSDAKSIYGRLGSEGVTCVKTKRAVLVGLYADGMQAGTSTVVVEALGDYLSARDY
ncbi:profilin, required for normal timing of actin polymerization in response to thermal stress [Mortierella sp. NVP85]|nr:profilin, required for normal timing of actin polymerization in response to thermal stress [Mortierella sp. NVP85]